MLPAQLVHIVFWLLTEQELQFGIIVEQDWQDNPFEDIYVLPVQLVHIKLPLFVEQVEQFDIELEQVWQAGLLEGEIK